tara:strand:- start:2173 stop:3330 length:1158 start_codon:yes stop_codon:yes gene_type:complete
MKFVNPFPNNLDLADITGVDLTGSLPITINSETGITSGDYSATIGVDTATTDAKGVVELATTAEVTTGTDAGRVVTPDGLKDGYQGSTNITTLGNISTCAGFAMTGDFAQTSGDMTLFHAANDANPTISLGSSATERLEIKAQYESGAQGLDVVKFITHTAGGSSDDARFAFNVDETFIFNILDAGVRIKSSGILEMGSGNTILSDSSGTTTLSNIDALDATTTATIQAAQLIHYDFQGYGTGDGTNFEMSKNVATNTAPFNHDVSIGSDGLTAQTVQTWMRLGGKVMPKACTLKRITGWSTTAGSATANIGLFKVTPTRNNNSNVSAVELADVSYTAMGNAKMEDHDVTSFTATAIAAGDILFTALKSESGAIQYFSLTVEVEL